MLLPEDLMFGYLDIIIVGVYGFLILISVFCINLSK